MTKLMLENAIIRPSSVIPRPAVKRPRLEDAAEKAKRIKRMMKLAKRGKELF